MLLNFQVGEGVLLVLNCHGVLFKNILSIRILCSHCYRSMICATHGFPIYLLRYFLSTSRFLNLMILLIEIR